MIEDVLKQAIEFIGDVYAGEWHGSILRREQLEKQLRQAIADLEKQEREWVGLTDEDICPWFQQNTALTNEAAMIITRAIEAKLKEKNGIGDKA